MGIDSQARVVSSLSRHFGVAVVISIVLIFLAQFAVLATLGTKGAEITSIRREKDQLRIANEHLRSEIDRSRTLAQIEDGLDDIFDLNRTNVRVVHNSSDTGSLSSAQVNP